MKIRLLVSFGGFLEQHDSPRPGAVIEVSDALGVALCADGRAEQVSPTVEAAATVGAPERAVRVSAAKRKGAR